MRARAAGGETAEQPAQNRCAGSVNLRAPRVGQKARQKADSEKLTAQKLTAGMTAGMIRDLRDSLLVRFVYDCEF
jgi:hypothetical protein